MSDLHEVVPDFDIKPYTHLLHSLEKNDITVADLITLDPKEIARKCPLPSADVQKLVTSLIQALQRDVQNGVTKKRKVPGLNSVDAENGAPAEKSTAANLLGDYLVVKTLDSNIDQALGGGFQPGHITEIVGESAVGKTQFVLGLLLSVQLPPPKGLGRGAIYVSTEAALSTLRLTQMLRSHPEYQQLAPEQRPSLDHVHTITTNDLEAQEHILRYQVPVAVERFNIGLIVLDSVAANFRAEHETRTAAGLAERAVELGKLASMLRRVAIDNHAVVVVTNQVSDRFNDARSLLLASSPATTSSPALPGSSLPAAFADRRKETQSLDHQQRFFTGWGDERPGKEVFEQLKTPALGLAWANQISARIVLKMVSERQVYSGGNIWRDKKKSRTFGVVFAPWAAPTNPPVRYGIESQGIVSITRNEDEALPAMGEEHADLLNEELWATDEDEEFP